GIRGIEGKLEAIRVAREEGIPFLGLCLGLQCAVIEFARNASGLEGANSSEFDPATPHPVVDIMPDQRDVDVKGGTMRLGLWPAKLKPGTRAAFGWAGSVPPSRWWPGSPGSRPSSTSASHFQARSWRRTCCATRTGREWSGG